MEVSCESVVESKLCCSARQSICTHSARCSQWSVAVCASQWLFLFLFLTGERKAKSRAPWTLHFFQTGHTKLCCSPFVFFKCSAIQNRDKQTVICKETFWHQITKHIFPLPHNLHKNKSVYSRLWLWLLYRIFTHVFARIECQDTTACLGSCKINFFFAHYVVKMWPIESGSTFLLHCWRWCVWRF